MTEAAERIVLASRPVGEPTLDNFRLERVHCCERSATEDEGLKMNPRRR
jgi:hypothetical protein